MINIKLGKLLFIPDEQRILSSKLILLMMNTKFNHPKTFYFGWTKNVTIWTNFIPDEQKILPFELKDVEFKIGQVTFYSG